MTEKEKSQTGNPFTSMIESFATGIKQEDMSCVFVMCVRKDGSIFRCLKADDLHQFVGSIEYLKFSMMDDLKRQEEKKLAQADTTKSN